MKSSDIKTGKEYAYQAHSWNPGVRVKVVIPLATKPGFLVEVVGSETRGYRAGQTLAVTSRQITQEWAPFEAEQRQLHEQAQARYAESKARELKNTQDAVVLESILKNLGLDTSWVKPDDMRIDATTLVEIIAAVRA